MSSAEKMHLADEKDVFDLNVDLIELAEKRTFWFSVFTHARKGMLVTKIILFNMACILALYVLHHWFNEETFGFYNVATAMSLVNIFGLEVGKDLLQAYAYSRHLMFAKGESTTTKLICFGTMFFPDVLASSNLYFVYLLAEEYQPLILLGTSVYLMPILCEYAMAFHIYRLTKRLEDLGVAMAA